LIAKTFEESDNNKSFDIVNKPHLSKTQNKRLSAKIDKRISNMEIKLEQNVFDQIYRIAPHYQTEIDNENAVKKEIKFKKTALALLSQSDVPKIALNFTIHLPDGTTEVRDFNATLPLMELLETICLAKGISLTKYQPKTMNDKELDLDIVLGEIKKKKLN